MYLNKEFQRRRNWVCSTTSHGNIRCQEMFKRYPCFKNHVEVLILASYFYSSRWAGDQLHEAGVGNSIFHTSCKV